LFSLGWSIIFFPFSLWLWYKTNQNASSLSEKGLRLYYYSLFFLILSIMFYGLFGLWIYLRH